MFVYTDEKVLKFKGNILATITCDVWRNRSNTMHKVFLSVARISVQLAENPWYCRASLRNISSLPK